MSWALKFPTMEQVNAGVMSCEAGDGPRIWMIFSEPGRYYDCQGKEVSEGAAERAGFDTSHWRLQRLKGERLAAAQSRIAEEMAQLAAQDAARKAAEAAKGPKPEPKAAPAREPRASAARDFRRDLW